MDGVKLQEILAELIRARIALRPCCTGEAISVEQAVQLMGVAHEAVARAIETLREMVPRARGKVGLAQFSAKSRSLRIVSVSEIFGFWRFPQALARLSSFETNMLCAQFCDAGIHQGSDRGRIGGLVS